MRGVCGDVVGSQGDIGRECGDSAGGVLPVVGGEGEREAGGEGVGSLLGLGSCE